LISAAVGAELLAEWLARLPGGGFLRAISALKRRVTGGEFLRAIRRTTSLVVPDQFDADQDVLNASAGDPSQVWPAAVAWATGDRVEALTPKQEERARRLVEPGGAP
jgi:hypothetical protein